VVPAPHERYGEVPFAFVRPRPGTTLDVAELEAFCAVGLAVFKTPKSGP